LKRTKEKLKDIIREDSRNHNLIKKEFILKMKNLILKVQILIKELVKFRLLGRFSKELIKFSLMLTFLMLMKKKCPQILLSY